MVKIIIYILLCAFLLLGYIRYLENRGIFFPLKEIEYTPDTVGLNSEDIYFLTKDGFKINGWFIANPNAKYTLFFLHGNGGNISHRLDKLQMLYGLGLNLFIIDYRGYGRSEGKPSENGLYIDAKSGYDYLVNEKKVIPENIILYGESLGTAVAVNLASELKIKAIILEGAFSSGREMAKVLYPFFPAFAFSDKFNSLKKIKKIPVPKLFLHSSEDEIVPFKFAKKLFDAAPNPKYFSELIGGHNTAFFDAKEKYLSAIAAFIDKL